MDMIPKITIYHNLLQSWLIGIGIAVLFLLAVLIVRRIVHKKMAAFAAGTPMVWDDIVVELIESLHALFFLALAVYFGSLYLSLPKNVATILAQAVAIIALLQAAMSSSHAVTFWVAHFHKKKIASNAAAVTTLTSVGFILRMTIWVILLLIGLSTLGVNITALVAGLGISGVAVALAIQNILGDLFASFSIVLDKPFVIDDFIIVDDYMGTIEHVGLKTTRLRSLSGEQLIFSNTDLLKSRIRNYKRMYERRVVFSIGVVYQTSHEQITRIPAMIRSAIEKNSQVRFDRAHFKGFGDYALQFEVVYWVLNPDYTVYMDIQQSINLDIFKQFEEAGIEFAYPTQSLFLQASPDGGDAAGESKKSRPDTSADDN
jgi:small-conductance mechanosensitive channel